MSDRINLPLVPGELRKLTGGAPKYPRLWNAAVAGELPGAVYDNGRWYVPRDRLREIAEALGLMPRKAA